MNFEIVVNEPFDRLLKKLNKKYKSVKDDLKELFRSLETEPTQGIPLGKNCYEIRLAVKSKVKGKSAGARVITCVKVIETTVYLVAIYDKSDIENISDNDLTGLLKEAGLI